MAASYPSATKAFTTKNTGDTVQAAHINDLQDEVTAIEDALINGLAHPLLVTGQLSATGVLVVTGLGAHRFTVGGVGVNSVQVRNTTAGTGNYAAFFVGNDAAATGAGLILPSTTWTTAGAYFADGLWVGNVGAGGISISAEGALGAIRNYTGGGTLRGGISKDGLLEHNNAAAFSGILTPSQITSNQDNYAPGSFSSAFFVRLSSDAARDMTGLAGGSGGRLVVLSNQGSFTITLKHDSGSSTAGNRFLCPGAADFSLTTFKTCLVYYDSTATAWTVIG